MTRIFATSASGSGGGTLSVKEDGSVVVSSASVLNFIEPDAILVTESPSGTARIDTSQYALLAGRSGGQILYGAPNGTYISNNSIVFLAGNALNQDTGVSSISGVPPSAASNLIVVTVVTDNTVHADQVTTGITYRGNNFTRPIAGQATGDFRIEKWYLKGVTCDGSSSIVVTQTGVCDIVVLLYSAYSGVDQTTPIEASNAASGSSASSPARVTLTTSSSFAYIEDANINGGVPTSPSSPQVEIFNFGQGGTSYKGPLATAGSYNMDWTYSGTTDWVGIALAIKPAGGLTTTLYASYLDLENPNSATGDAGNWIARTGSGDALATVPYGKFEFQPKGGTISSAFLDFNSITADQTFTFPDASGTLVLGSSALTYLLVNYNGFVLSGGKAGGQTIIGATDTDPNSNLNLNANASGIMGYPGGSIGIQVEKNMSSAVGNFSVFEQNSSVHLDASSNEVGVNFFGIFSFNGPWPIDNDTHNIAINIVVNQVQVTGNNKTIANNFGIINSPTFIGDTGSITVQNFAAIYNNLQLDISNGGTALATNVYGISDQPHFLSASGTITNRYGVKMYDKNGAGSQGTVIGLDVDDQTVTTAALSLRSVGANVVMEHAGQVTLGLAGTKTGTLKFKGTTSGVVTVIPADVAGTWTLKLPTTGGTNKYLLQTDGSGVSTWGQADLTAAVTGVLPIANGGTGATTLAGAGLISSVASTDLTAQTAAITATTLFTPSTTGMYRLTVYLQVTTPAGVSSVLGGASGVVITYNDGDGNVAQTDTMGLFAPNGTVVSTINTNTTTTNLTGSIEIYAKTGVAIQYAIGYTSVGTAMQYAAHLRLEKI